MQELPLQLLELMLQSASSFTLQLTTQPKPSPLCEGCSFIHDSIKLARLVLRTLNSG